MAEKQFDSIVDAMLADREPDWDALDLKDAKKSGEDVLGRTHDFVDKDFIDEISEAASKHTPIWGPKNGKTLQNRLYEKEKAAPQVASVKADWRKDARRDQEAYSTQHGSDDQLMDEVTMELEKAKTKGFDSKAITDATGEAYAKNLLKGKHARRDQEAYSTQHGSDDAQFAASTMEPSKAKSDGTVESKEVSDATVLKYVRDLLNQGMSPSKVAMKLADLELFDKQKNMGAQYLKDNAGLMGLAYLEPNTFMDKQNPNYKHNASVSSNDCVRQHTAWKNAGIKPMAKSVKQINACAGCSYFKKNGAAKSCNLYHLPVVANTVELSQIVNNLTPGVPLKQKRAALIQIAEREDQHVHPFDAGKTAQTSITKTADTHVDKQLARRREAPKMFTSDHVAKLHEKNVPLAKIYAWADKKFGSVETSVAFRGFVQSFRKDKRGKFVLASGDIDFLTKLGIRNEKFEASAKCASCPAHFGIEARPVSDDRGAMRVGGKFAQRTLDAVRVQKTASAAVFNSDVVEKLHGAGHSIEKIFKGGANKVGSVQAKKAVIDFVNSIKNKPIKVALSQIDCTFLKNKLAVHNPIVGAAKCGSCSYRSGMHCGLTGGTLLSFPGMNGTAKKTASDDAKDGHSILNEYDLSSATPIPDIDMSEPERLDVQVNKTFKLDE